MSKAFELFYEIKKNISSETREDIIEKFIVILDYLFEDIRDNTLTQHFIISTILNEEMQIAEVSQPREQVVEEILTTFEELLGAETVINQLSTLANHLSQINQPSLASVIEVINDYILANSQDSELIFEMDLSEEENSLPDDRVVPHAATDREFSEYASSDNNIGYSIARDRAQSITDFYVKNKVMSGSVGSGVESIYYSNPSSYSDEVFKFLGDNPHPDRNDTYH